MALQSTSKWRHFGSRPSLTGHGSSTGCDVKQRTRLFCISHKVYLFVGKAGKVVRNNETHLSFQNHSIHFIDPSGIKIKILNSVGSTVNRHRRFLRSRFKYRSFQYFNVDLSQLLFLSVTLYFNPRRIPVQKSNKTQSWSYARHIEYYFFQGNVCSSAPHFCYFNFFL